MNESPQAQEPPAFGLSIVKPCFSMVSTKSITAPCRYGALIRSTPTLRPVEIAEQVAVERAVVEEQLVAQACTAAGLHGDAQVHVVAALLLEQGASLDGGGVGELDAVGLDIDGRGVLDGHGTPNNELRLQHSRHLRV